MTALSTPPVTLGWQAADFQLKGTDGKIYTLKDVRGPKGLVVMFICNHCPFVQAVADKISRDTADLAKHGIGAVAIMANDPTDYPEDSFEKMAVFAQQHRFPFPYVIDATQLIARTYGAVCTPDFFGFDSDLKLQYRGRLDDSGMKHIEGGQRELFDAMKQVAATGKAPERQNPSIGCSIKWRDDD